MTSLTTTAGLAHAASTLPIAYFPLNYYNGPNHKISTNLISDHRTIEVVYDLGSDTFWTFGPNSTENWGCTSLFCPGPCNITVTDYYDWPASSTASKPSPASFFASYGDFTKFVSGDITINDTLTFTSVADQSSTIPNVEVAVVNYMQQRLGTDGTCNGGVAYDLGILGVAPYQHSASWNTSGPNVRHELLQQGTISAPVHCMWFDQAPEAINGTYTGGAIMGGIDTSKFSGQLVEVISERSDPSDPTAASVGYYVPPPSISVNGTILSDVSAALGSQCQIDSGTSMDSLPIGNQTAFQLATGVVTTPEGYLAWPGECASIPGDVTLDMEFQGKKDGESVTVKVPLRNYARDGYTVESGYCALNFELEGCLLASPFSTAAFFAADDERGSIALAQGGVAERGSGVDYGRVVDSIPV
ncbi:acid protease [Aspergillus sclerotioniger CBS 115572]|uniref:Acid protease n=1 Tax=Aspergillus sclerotioniger CBS 115572 TaxID=1450535 RepID=A0A317X358_9EURO|nr:acid protease [Aspergillus sclerotioniger CBS 115572]PWY92993.1 acid protease [Aspergillus sclerotioniger CBS 115572]